VEKSLGLGGPLDSAGGKKPRQQRRGIARLRARSRQNRVLWRQLPVFPNQQGQNPPLSGLNRPSDDPYNPYIIAFRTTVPSVSSHNCRQTVPTMQKVRNPIGFRTSAAYRKNRMSGSTFAFSGCFGFLFAFDTGFFVMLAFSHFSKHTGAGA